MRPAWDIIVAGAGQAAPPRAANADSSRAGLAAATALRKRGTGAGYNPLMIFACGLAAAALATTAGEPQWERLLARVGEEAEVLRENAVKLIARETLRQRALRQPRFRLRFGKSAREPAPPQYRTREIVSEYSYGVLRESPGVLHEFRQVIRVDGRAVNPPLQARRKLIASLRSEDDRARRRLLESFGRYTLRSAATDFGLALLLFTPRRLPEFRFQPAGRARVGAEAALLLRFHQVAGTGAITVYQGRQVIRRPLEGDLWVRESDGLPLRIVLHSRRQEDNRELTDTATVDYMLSRHGVVVPVSILRRLHAGGLLIEEDLFEYSDFRMFVAEAEVKFP